MDHDGFTYRNEEGVQATPAPEDSGKAQTKKAARVTGLPFWKAVEICAAVPLLRSAAGVGLHRCQGAFFALLYFAAVLPKRLRKRSTRPPMLSTDFCVPV